MQHLQLLTKNTYDPIRDIYWRGPYVNKDEKYFHILLTATSQDPVEWRYTWPGDWIFYGKHAWRGNYYDEDLRWNYYHVRSLELNDTYENFSNAFLMRKRNL